MVGFTTLPASEGRRAFKMLVIWKEAISAEVLISDDFKLSSCVDISRVASRCFVEGTSTKLSLKLSDKSKNFYLYYQYYHIKEEW